jgi:hypothetical protein
VPDVKVHLSWDSEGVMSDQRELFGLVASAPTAWRRIAEVARGVARADRRITAAANAARRHGWTQVAARHGALPGVRGLTGILPARGAPTPRPRSCAAV